MAQKTLMLQQTPRATPLVRTANAAGQHPGMAHPPFTSGETEIGTDAQGSAAFKASALRGMGGHMIIVWSSLLDELMVQTRSFSHAFGLCYTKLKQWQMHETLTATGPESNGIRQYRVAI